MKDTFKRLTKLGILVFGTSLFLTNCEQDIINSQEIDTSVLMENGLNDKIKTGKLNDYKKLKSFVQTIKAESEIESNRTSIEENNGFTIREDNDIYIYTDSTSTTYTISIQKEVQSTFGFSNLIVKFFDDLPTAAYILNYEPSQAYLNSYVNDPQTAFQGTISYESLDYDGSLDDLNARVKCKSITLTYCNYGGDTHAAGENCTEEYMFEVNFELCVDSTDNSSQNESIDEPAGPITGGGSTPNSDPTKPLPSDTCEDTETGEVGLTGINGECLSSEVFKLEEQLNNIVGEDNYAFDESLSDNEVIAFDNVNGFEGFYGSLFNDVQQEASTTENDDGVSETKTFNYNFELGVFSYTMKIEVESLLPSENSCDCMEVTGVNAILIGNTTLVEWEQIGSHTTQVSPDGTKLSVFTRGTMTIGIKIDGYPFNITELVTFVQVFDHSTGQVTGYYMIRE